MTSKLCRHPLAVVATLAACLLCCGATASAQATSYLQSVSAREAPGVTVVGQGAHAWRFVVRHPERPRQPYRLAGYQVRLPDGMKLANGDTAVMGTTDAQGRTAIIRVQGPSNPSDWVVLPAWGQGPRGVAVAYTDGLGHAESGYPYTFEIDDGPIHCGLSLPTGHTAYLMIPPGRKALHRERGTLQECQALQKALNPIVSQKGLKARLAGLKRLQADPRWAAQQALLRDKVQAIVLYEGSQADVVQLVRERVDEDWGISKTEQAGRLNNIGYALLTLNPPRFPELAAQLIDRSVALDASPYNLDTQGWSRHLQGRHEDALAVYAQALQGFQGTCDADAQEPYLTTLGHQAETLWAMGRTDEATDLWAEVERNAARHGFGETWATGLSHWLEARSAIQARVAALHAQGAAVQPDCSDLRDRSVQ